MSIVFPSISFKTISCFSERKGYDEMLELHKLCRVVSFSIFTEASYQKYYKDNFDLCIICTALAWNKEINLLAINFFPLSNNFCVNRLIDKK